LEIKRYRKSSPKAKKLANVIKLIEENFTRIDTVLKYLEKLRPELIENFIFSLSKLIQDRVTDFNIDYSSLNLDDIKSKLVKLDGLADLQHLILYLTIHELNLSRDYHLGLEEVEVLLFDWLRATNVLKYFRVKAFTEILERQEGIQLWKDLAYKVTEDALNQSEEEIHPPIKEITEGWIKACEEEDASFDMTIVKYDDYKVALKFDKCPVYEATKHLEDPEIVYLSWCWTGFPEEKLNKRSRRKRTPQTLHDSAFCVEFYWNNDVHPDAEPPPLEFWKDIVR
jgi:hypothetical protein